MFIPLASLTELTETNYITHTQYTSQEIYCFVTFCLHNILFDIANKNSNTHFHKCTHCIKPVITISKDMVVHCDKML